MLQEFPDDLSGIARRRSATIWRCVAPDTEARVAAYVTCHSLTLNVASRRQPRTRISNIVQTIGRVPRSGRRRSHRVPTGGFSQCVRTRRHCARRGACGHSMSRRCSTCHDQRGFEGCRRSALEACEPKGNARAHRFTRNSVGVEWRQAKNVNGSCTNLRLKST